MGPRLGGIWEGLTLKGELQGRVAKLPRTTGSAGS